MTTVPRFSLAALQTKASADENSRLILADAWEDIGRLDVARLWRDELPATDGKRRKRIDSLTAQEKSRFHEWVKKWTDIGLSTDMADRPLFEAAVSACYRFSGLRPPCIVWVPNPLVAALAGPIASWLIYGQKLAVGGAIDGAVRGAIDGAVRDAIDGAIDGAVKRVLSSTWHRYIGGQFWVGWGYWWGSPSFVSFMTDVCGLDLDREMELRARAYQAASESACWWFPLRDVVFVSERPHALEFNGTPRRGSLVRAAWDSWEVRP